jgi:hypothetical protein
MDVILKNLTDSNIIVQDTIEKRENRNRLVENEEEEDDENNLREAEEDDEEPAAVGHAVEDKEDPKTKKAAALRAGRRKAMQAQKKQT